MRTSEHLKFAVRGFSPKRMAYMLVLISAGFWPFHFRADWRGDEYLSLLALVCMMAAFVLGYFVPRSDKKRFLPAVLGLFVLMIHWFSCKL